MVLLPRTRGLTALGVMLAFVLVLGAVPAAADLSAQTLPFSQNWGNTALITTSDDWSGVPGVVGYRGDDMTTLTGADPQTLLSEGTVVVDVNANQTNPDTFATGGVAEFDIADDVVGLTGSGTADAPYLLFGVNTSGQSSINVSYKLRDLDASIDNAVQQVAAQYRVGNSGSFTNLPAGYVADATTGPSLATLVTPVTVTLPAAAENQPLVQVRVLTSNAVGNDEWVGVDDISVATGTTNPSGTGLANPATVVPGNTSQLTVAVTPGALPTSTNITVAADLSSIGGLANQTLFDDGAHGDGAAADNTFGYQPTVALGTVPGAKSLPVTIGDAQGRSAATTIALTVAGPLTPIHEIQGATHVSPFAGQAVSANGIVTARSTNGFWMQDPSPDANDATSEGIFVFTTSAPTVSVGDSVRVSATVQEFRPGGPTSSNLSTTELALPTISVVSTGNTLPAPIIAGAGGRTPPGTVIEDDATGDVETAGVIFDPANDGLDFWESLEGMRVQLNDPVAVGPTNSFGETSVVGDNGVTAALRTARGGLLARPTDFNPERVVLDDILTPVPAANVGDHYTGAVTGVLDYNFGNFFLEVTQAAPVVHDGVLPESTVAQGARELAVATFNVENLAPGDPQAKFDRLATLIVDNMKTPDVISVEEVQDNSGATNNGIVAADQTVAKLVAAIIAAGGPTYDWRAIDPVNNADGGAPGGNIRQVFLFNPGRVSFVDRPGGTSTTATTVTGSGASTALTFSPGRIDPTNTAWNASRKPLAGEFMFQGSHFFVIANHFNSKGGDNALEGHFQPPVRISEVQRHQQAQLVHDFVAQILAGDPNATVVVDGDLNDFEFSDTVSILKAGVLHTLIDTLPQNERYSYVFEGNSQSLDHILVSDVPFGRVFAYDVVHVNAEFADQASDHDPSVARLTFNDPPTVDAGGPYSVFAGFTVGVNAAGSDPNGDTLTYAWDLDDNGSFETAGQSATFSAASAPAPGTRTIHVRATDPGELAAVDSATVTITVTYDSLCALTRNLVTKDDVESDLCEMLAGAAKAEAKGKTEDHDKKLEDYRSLLDKQIGKSVSAAAAAQLKSLSRYL